jgi:hypothetical protein
MLGAVGSPANNKKPRRSAVFAGRHQRLSALSGLVSGIGLVDHVDAPFAPHDAAVLVPCLERFERILDFHGRATAKAGKVGENRLPSQLPGESFSN